MSTLATYRISTPPFAHQDIDGEIVIVNVETGVYYSLRGTGADVFGQLVAGASAADAARALGARYSAEPAEVEAQVQRLVGELVSEGILVAAPRPDATPAPAFTGERAPFTAPFLERFTDMKDLLLLDPIHEVGDAGWPIVKTPGT